MLHNKVKSSPNLHSRLPVENHYLHSWRYTKGHTDFSSHVQTGALLQMGHGVTEINLPHFLVHVGRLLLWSTSEEQKLKGRYLLCCNITGRWLGFFFSVIEFPLGSQSPLNQGFDSSVNTGDSVKGKWVLKEGRVVFPRATKG